jgi:UDP-glucose 4-epimerase
MTKNNWIVTGGCGFIGTAVVLQLLSEKLSNKITIIDNFETGSFTDLQSSLSRIGLDVANPADLKKLGIELVVADIRDSNEMDRACKGGDTLIHLAAQSGVGPSVLNPRLDFEVNCLGTLNVLEAARKNRIQKFLFASSGAPLGNAKQPISELSVPRPVSPYGASKLAGEGYCSAYSETFGICTTALRLSNVYGPGSHRKKSLIANIITRGFDSKTIEVFGDGEKTRDFVYIEDVVAAIIKASRQKNSSEVIHVCTGVETAVNDVVSLVCSHFRDLGKAVSVKHTEARKGDAESSIGDPSAAKKIIGFEPAVDLKLGIFNTFEYFKCKFES